jgi:hypothetical protein
MILFWARKWVKLVMKMEVSERIQNLYDYVGVQVINGG